MLNGKCTICSASEPCPAIWNVQKPKFQRYLPIRCAYSTHRCLELEIWRFPTTTTTDGQTDCFTPCAYARGNNHNNDDRRIYRLDRPVTLPLAHARGVGGGVRQGGFGGRNVTVNYRDSEWFGTMAACPHRGGFRKFGVMGGVGVGVCPLFTWLYDQEQTKGQSTSEVIVHGANSLVYQYGNIQIYRCFTGVYRYHFMVRLAHAHAVNTWPRRGGGWRRG